MNDLTDIYARAAETLAQLMPAELKARCDRGLDEQATPRQRWAKYDVAYTWHQHVSASEPAKEQP